MYFLFISYVDYRQKQLKNVLGFVKTAFITAELFIFSWHEVIYMKQIDQTSVHL